MLSSTVSSSSSEKHFSRAIGRAKRIRQELLQVCADAGAQNGCAPRGGIGQFESVEFAAW